MLPVCVCVCVCVCVGVCVCVFVSVRIRCGRKCDVKHVCDVVNGEKQTISNFTVLMSTMSMGLLGKLSSFL